MAALQQKGKIVIGVKYDQNGFGLKNPTNNKIEGFDVEMGKLIAQGVYGGTKDGAESKIEFVETVSKNREAFIRDSKTDVVIATYTINDTRKTQIDFAGPYYVAHGDVMVKETDNTIKSVTDLNGKNVCAVQGSTYPASLKTKAPSANVTQLDKYSDCTDALKDNRVAALTTDNVILAGIVQANPGQFKLINANYTDEPYGIGIKKGDDTFRTWLNDRIDALYKSGEWKTAYESTLGKIGLPTPPPPPVDRYGLSTTTTASGAGTTVTTAGGTATTVTTAKS